MVARAGPDSLGYAESMRVIVRSAIVVACCGCGDKDFSPAELCAGAGEVSVELGHGTGADFTAFEAGEDVDIAIAPQGGYGVNVRVMTLGLVANNAVTLELSSTHLGESTGSFNWGEIPLYCLDDGHGLLWGAVVPFDPELFPDVESLSALDGEPIHMSVELVDAEGVQGSGSADVVAHLREQ